MSELWKEITEMFRESTNTLVVKELPQSNYIILQEMRINENSVLGQILVHTAGIIVNNIIRIFSNGNNENSHNIYNYNLELEKFFGDKKLFIGDDIFGGLFAINNGAFDGKNGEIWYFAPDTLGWDNLEINYAEFIAWISSENLNEFYSSFKWNNFINDIINVKYNQGILIYPFLWSAECDIEKAKKTVVSFKELLLLNLKFSNNIK